MPTKTRAWRPSRQRSRERGSIYLAVMAVAVVVFTIGLGALMAVRAQAKSSDNIGDAAEARLYANSAIELVRAWIYQTPTWRSDYTTLVNLGMVTNRPIGSGTFSLTLTNPNGALTRIDSDPVIISATGYRRQAVQGAQVTLTAVQTPYTCLNVAAAANSTITFSGATVGPASAKVASNGAITASGSTINPDTEAVSTISGSNYVGNKTTSVAARTFPDTVKVFEYYTANGTTISASALNYRLRRCVLSPASNPTGGATNSQGIYIIDCGGIDFEVRDCRIVGTVVLLNPGAGTQIYSSVSWVPAVSTYPCLLVNGGITIQHGTTSLSEATEGVNFNPSGTPYPYSSGSTNSTTSDSYPSAITGLVYATGNVTLSNTPTLTGLITNGSLTANGASVTFNVNSNQLSAPPPGFYTVQMTLQSGSYQQVVY